MAVKTEEPSLKRATLPEKLNQPCRDEHLCEVARHITDWPALAPLMGIKAQEMEEIRGKWPFSIGGQRMEFLRKWKDKCGQKGTYKRLSKVFRNAGEISLAEKVCDVLCRPSDSESSSEESEEDQLSQSSPSSHPKLEVKRERPPSPHCRRPPSPTIRPKVNSLDSLAAYLRMTYGSQTPDFVVFQWPPPPTLKVFNLAMILSSKNIRRNVDTEFVGLTLRGNVDGIMERNTSIKLQNLFKVSSSSLRKRQKIVLIEGAPGAGKSTLAWDICQKWEAQELFHEEFKVVVYVQLGDLEVQSANEIADLLPFKLQSKQKDAANSIEECHGEGVLFVLDGWDEYSPGLQRDSLFEKLICHPSKLSVQLSTVLITSRPIASGKLQPYATSRVEIVGFTSDEVCKYFNDVFGDPLTVYKLYDQLKDRPMIKASCYLPLNAAIVAHLFMELDHTLPTTLHGVITSLVLSCIIRHLTKQSETKPMITSLDDLPPDVEEVFQKVCTLAYKGAVSNKTIFSGQDLQSYGLPEDLNALSLMQVVQSFATGKPTSYHFLHLSIQELLAALHISKLPPPEQVQVFNELFGLPRFKAVFCFYAAFTKLQSKDIRDVVVYVAQSEQKSLLLDLVHCLYEAQDVSLCHFFCSQILGRLDLRTTLSSFDFVSLNYFLSCINSPGPATGSDSVSCDVPLSIYLPEEGVSSKDVVSLRNLVHISLTVSCTCAADLLTNNSQLKVLKLSHRDDDTGELFAAVLKEHPSLEVFQFSDKGVTIPFVSGKPLIRMSWILKAIHSHQHLKRLHLGKCGLDMNKLAAALEVNETLQELLIDDIVITDDSLTIIANSLKRNTTLN